MNLSCGRPASPGGSMLDRSGEYFPPRQALTLAAALRLLGKLP